MVPPHAESVEGMVAEDHAARSCFDKLAMRATESDAAQFHLTLSLSKGEVAPIVQCP